jgi:hypothetical protein
MQEIWGDSESRFDANERKRHQSRCFRHYQFHVCSPHAPALLPTLLPTYVWGKIGFNDLSDPVSAPIHEIRKVDGQVSITLIAIPDESDEEDEENDEDYEVDGDEEEEEDDDDDDTQEEDEGPVMIELQDVVDLAEDKGQKKNAK